MVEILSQNYTQTPKNFGQLPTCQETTPKQKLRASHNAVFHVRISYFHHVFTMTFQGVRGMMVGTTIDENIPPFVGGDL